MILEIKRPLKKHPKRCEKVNLNYDKKIVEMGGGGGGGPAVAASLMDHQQYGPVGPGVYSEHAGLNNASTSGNMDNVVPPLSASSQEVAALAAAQIRQRQHQVGLPSPDGAGSMQPPPTMSEADMLHRLSLNSVNNNTHMTAVTGGMDEFPHPGAHQNIRSLRPSLQGRGSLVANELDFPGSNLSLMTCFSAYGDGNPGPDHMVASNSQMAGIHGGGRIGDVSTVMTPSGGGRGMENRNAQDLLMYGNGTTPNFGVRSGGDGGGKRSSEDRQFMPNMAPPANVTSGGTPFQQFNLDDRRNLFSRMKYPRAVAATGSMHRGSSHHGPGSMHSTCDGMPDIHMVESQLSLMSNITDHRSNHAAASAGIHERKPVRTQDDIGIGTSSSHSAAMDLGSRHSIMSGHSKLSNTSIDASIFSGLSSKIGNVSTRSITMSEISGLDLAVDVRLADQGIANDEDLFADGTADRVSAADIE